MGTPLCPGCLPQEKQDVLLYSEGHHSTADLRMKMQKTMQTNAAVYRTGEILEEGVTLIDDDVNDFKNDVGIKDRSLIWNTDPSRRLSCRISWPRRRRPCTLQRTE